MKTQILIKRRFSFDAAHHLPQYEGPCKNVHGHRWEVIVCFKYTGSIEDYCKNGCMTVDFKVIDKAIQTALIDKYDHSDLNKFFDNPTAEEIALQIIGTVNAVDWHVAEVKSVEVFETPKSSILVETI